MPERQEEIEYSLGPQVDELWIDVVAQLKDGQQQQQTSRVDKYVPTRHLCLDVSSRPPSVDNGMALRQMGISSGTPSFGRRQGRAIMAAVLRACAIANPPFGKVYILDHITWMPTVVT